MQTKFLFITGGVLSSLGKGLTSASIALLLEKRGHKVALLKLDPYLNVDPGTMNPFQHGEVYVTDDGAECDLDLGHYYRYTRSPLSKLSNTTSGQIYDAVIKRERKGDYLGNTVQVIPHITDEIKRRILNCAKQDEEIEVVLVEIGGTVGDIESLPFLEAIRQFECEHRSNCINIHLTYVPYLRAAGEVKTKPSQHSVQTLRSIGLFPNIILCRCEESLDESTKAKIGQFCNVPKEAVIDEPDVKHSIYEVPIELHQRNLDGMICDLLDLKKGKVDLRNWTNLVKTIKNPKGKITVAVIGKYVQHQDAYKSVFEALHHGANACGYTIDIKRIGSDKIIESEKLISELEGCHGVLVPGGFGERGWEGKVLAAKHCRENKIPYLGICLGMHVMSVEFARNVLGLSTANSTEMDPGTADPIISILTEQESVTNLGGTMRLGAYPCKLKKGSKAYQAYGEELISERHRHRYEFNNSYLQAMEEKGFLQTGTFTEQELCEIVEIKEHPWMVGVQFHPEFKSKPTQASPLFKSFVEAIIKQQKGSNAH